MTIRDLLLTPIFGPPGDELARQIRREIARESHRNFAAVRVASRPRAPGQLGAPPPYVEHSEDDLRGEDYRPDPPEVDFGPLRPLTPDDLDEGIPL